MATLAELPAVFSNTELRNKISGAICIKAHEVLQTSPTEAQKEWAAKVLANPSGDVAWLLAYLIGGNAAQSVATILAATDDMIKTQISAAVDVFYPPAA